MFNLLRGANARSLLKTEAPSLAASLLIAELFYKFHSFLLESLAFLATWYVVGAVSDWLLRFSGTADRRTTI
jgi:hypothetical protein